MSAAARVLLKEYALKDESDHLVEAFDVWVNITDIESYWVDEGVYSFERSAPSGLEYFQFPVSNVLAVEIVWPDGKDE